MPVTFELVAAGLMANTSNIKQYNAQGILSYAQLDVGYLVRVIGETNPMLLPGDAEGYIKTVIPVGALHPQDALCRARNYSVGGIESADTVLVIVGFVFSEIPVNSTIWTIDSDSYAELEDTDVQYDGTGALVPIVVDNYILTRLTPADAVTGTPEQNAYGLVAAPRPRKRWTYTKQIYSNSAALTYDSATVNYVGCVNSTTFTGVSAGSFSQGLGLPAGTVLCWDAGVNFAPYQGQFIARALLIYKPEGWQPWARYSSVALGVPDNLWRTTSAGAANGMKQTTAIPTADLNTLLSLI